MVEKDLKALTAELFLGELDRREMSKSELARRMGLKKSAMTRTLSGSGNLTLDTLSQLGDALGVDVVIELRSRG